MSREIKRPEVKTTWTPPDTESNSIREFFCSQATSAYFPLYDAEEVTERKWQELIADINFGAELEYIRRRAFYCPPYSTPDIGGMSLIGKGWHKDLMNPRSLRLCVEIGIGPKSLELEQSIPLCIANNLHQLDYSLSPRTPFPTVALLRQWWRISSKFGLEPIKGFAVLTDFCNQFKMWSSTDGDCEIDSAGIDDDLKLRVIQTTLSGCFKDLLSDGNMLVSVTGAFSYKNNKVLIRILKPKKQ